MNPGRCAIFCGSFDPIHYGHIRIARYVQHRFSCKTIYFIPSYSFPNRKEAIVASGNMRIKLCKRALRRIPATKLLTHEIKREMPGYLTDTIATLQNRWHITTPINVIIGSDLMDEITHWKRWESLRSAAHFIVLVRDAQRRDIEAHLANLKLDYTLCDNPTINISSTVIRNAMRTSQRIDSFVPAAVARLIMKKQLYV